MPPKANLKFADYTFYFVPDKLGKYSFKDEQGNIYRNPTAEFMRLYKTFSPEEIDKIQTILGFANIRNVETGKYILVYEIFADLQKELDDEPASRQSIYIKHLQLENLKLKTENQTLRLEVNVLRREK